MSKRASDWLFYMNRDLWQYYKLQDLQDNARQGREAAIARTREASETVDSLTENQARSMLLLHSLVEALVRKGLISREELSAVVAELDVLDGKSDGKLAQAETDSARDDRPVSPEQYLRKLEKESG